MDSMYYIGLDVHKKTISYCIKNASGQVHREGTIGSTRNELDCWMKTLPQPWTVAMEATIFTGWIYDHLLPHAAGVKVAHPLMLRAIAAAKKRMTESMPAKLPTACVVTSCREGRGLAPMFRRFGLAVAPRFRWECLTNRTVNWFPAPATSHVACGFPALRAPAPFTSRFMGPITLERLPRYDGRYDTRYSEKSPMVPYSHSLLHRFQPKP